MIKNFKGAIFDLDGTLIDSNGIWKQIDIDFLGKRGFTVPTDYMAAISHLGAYGCALYTIDRFQLNETPESLIEEWTCMAKKAYSTTIKLKPYVKDFLQYLHKNEIPMAIATASQLELALPVLENNNVLSYFHSITTISEVNRGKGFPGIYEKAASKLGLCATDCVVFEDILKGIQGANLGNFYTIGVFDEHSKEDMNKIKKEANHYIYCYSELLKNI